MTEQENHYGTFEDLIIGHFDGNLSKDQERELAKSIAKSPESKRLFLSYMRLEGRLHSLGHDGFLSTIDAQTVDNKLNANPRPIQHSRFWAASSSIAVCAVFLVMLGWGLWPSSVSASGVLQKAKQAAAELVDRVYSVTLVAPDDGNSTNDQELMLHIRGENLFVIQPTDGSYLMGRDGSDYWLTHRSGPVWVTNDYRALAPELQRKIPHRRLLGLAASPDEPLMLHLSSLLSLIERTYDIELLESSDSGKNHIRATSRALGPNRPKTIDVWADAESGVVLRSELRWGNSRIAQFELVDSQTRSEQWYQYLQRAPNREVTRLEPAH